MVVAKELRSTRRGFTLIEIMMVIAIIGVLAAIAIPNFLRFQFRARIAEAPLMLGMIRTGQIQYFATHDCYMDINPNPGAIPPAGGVLPFNTAQSGIIPCSGGALEFADIGVDVGTPVHFQYQCTVLAVANTEGFACDAEADLDTDGVTSVWALCSDMDDDGVCDGPTAKGSLAPFAGEPIRVTSERF